MDGNFISAAIITRNEAQNIERCLNSLIGVVDEIVVVDSCSDDGTADICRRYGAKVTERPFAGYGSQRQYACTLANGRYVLSIDADEVLTERLRQSLLQLRQAPFRHRAYCFDVVNYISGEAVRHGGLEPACQTRLFDKRHVTWNLLDVGEHLIYTPGVSPFRLEGAIHHYRSASFEEFEQKELRHARLRGRIMAEAGIEAGAPARYLRAAAAFLGCGIADGALMEGGTGLRIALTRFRATLEAYRTASNILQEGK